MRKALCLIVFATVIAVAPAFGSVIVSGSAYGNLGAALTALGVSYTDAGGSMVDPSSYGAGDILIIGMDGDGGFQDYTSFLNAGGHLIVAGGSYSDGFRSWAANYFNITDTEIGWHMDGAWHTSGSNLATSYLPADYTFEDPGVSYHMLAFLPTDNTVLLGTNDEPNYVLALRTYDNGGTFEYLALDPGQYGTGVDLTSFTEPFLKGGLQAAGASFSSVPEPATCGLIGAGILLLALRAKRRRV